MKKVYNITVAQLLVLWIFGMIATVSAIDKASYSSFSTDFTLAEFLSWFIPLALYFYTIGWRAHTKKHKEEKIEALPAA